MKILAAVGSDFSDFEDAVLYFSGHDAGIDGIVTRNTGDFTVAQLPIYQPDALWALVQTLPKPIHHPLQ